MQLGTWIALLLTALTFAGYWLVPVRWRQPLLLVASYIFYAWAFPPYALLLAALTTAVFYVGRAVRRQPERSSRTYLIGGIVGVVGVLAFFKYGAFLTTTFDTLLGRAGLSFQLPVPEIMAPLGISFITFGLVHFLMEMRKGEAPEPSFVEFATFVAFFPTVASGPIKRYPEFVSDERSGPLRPSRTDIAYGLWRILLGAFRKFVIADTITVLVTPLYEVDTSSPLIWVAVYAYAIKIYFDFAGYTDMAIGTARLFGFTIIENFNAPYLRRNISEFWRNWHWSLTRFLTEYIYIPLGGSRGSRIATARNVIITFAISGLWHGAAWHFVAWGLWHGFGLVVWRQWRDVFAWLRESWPRLDGLASSGFGKVASYGFGWFVTFNFVALGWVMFVLPLPESLDVYTALVQQARMVLGMIRSMV